jgi:hypothetical protein
VSCFTTCGFRAKEKRLARAKPAIPAAMVSREGDIPVVASIQDDMKIEHNEWSVSNSTMWMTGPNWELCNLC